MSTHPSPKREVAEAVNSNGSIDPKGGGGGTGLSPAETSSGFDFGFGFGFGFGDLGEPVPPPDNLRGDWLELVVTSSTGLP